MTPAVYCICVCITPAGASASAQRLHCSRDPLALGACTDAAFRFGKPELKQSFVGADVSNRPSFMLLALFRPIPSCQCPCVPRKVPRPRHISEAQKRSLLLETKCVDAHGRLLVHGTVLSSPFAMRQEGNIRDERRGSCQDFCSRRATG